MIFNKIVNEEDILTLVEKSQILKELNLRVSKLDLKSPEEYYSKSKVQAFSLAEIFTHINSLEEQSINFDQLIDSLIYLSIEKKRKEKKSINLIKTQDDVPVKITSNFSLKKPEIYIYKEKEIIKQNRNFEEPILNIKEIPKEYKPQPIQVPHNNNQNKTIDLSYQEPKMQTYPELKRFSNLLHLSLAGNGLTSTKYLFPNTLQVLNLSSNNISEFNLDNDLENLLLLNLTSNHISIISGINHIKNIKELYLANNCITSINMLCHLNSLILLDCSHNEIEIFEDIAGLVISKRIGILKLRGNPLSSKLNYEQVVNSILSRIYCLDPLNIIELSSFKELGSLPFLPLKDILEEAEEKTPIPVRINLSNIKSETSLIIKKKSFSEIPNSPIEKKTINKQLKSSVTPLSSSKAQPKMQRSSSQIRIEKSSAFSSTSQSSINFAAHEDATRKASEYEYGFSIMDDAERRIKTCNDDTRYKSNVSVISNESINNVKKKVYGNPVAAMMIGPPAVPHLKARLPCKSPACLSLDLSKKRKFK